MWDKNISSSHHHRRRHRGILLLFNYWCRHCHWMSLSFILLLEFFYISPFQWHFLILRIRISIFSYIFLLIITVILVTISLDDDDAFIQQSIQWLILNKNVCWLSSFILFGWLRYFNLHSGTIFIGVVVAIQTNGEVPNDSIKIKGWTMNQKNQIDLWHYSVASFLSIFTFSMRIPSQMVK